MRHFSCILGHKCPYYAKDGLGILESPNFPGEYPAGKIQCNDFPVILGGMWKIRISGAECHWRVRPNRNKRVLVIMSSISLDEHCGDLLTVRKTDRANSGVIYETCESSDGPVIFTGHSRNIWVDFVANRNSSGRGFQISFLTIEDELGYLVDAIVNEDKIDSFDGRPNNNNMSLEVSIFMNLDDFFSYFWILTGQTSFIKITSPPESKLLGDYKFTQQPATFEAKEAQN